MFVAREMCSGVPGSKVSSENRWKELREEFSHERGRESIGTCPIGKKRLSDVPAALSILARVARRKRRHWLDVATATAQSNVR